jgi:hypothetical protein
VAFLENMKFTIKKLDLQFRAENSNFFNFLTSQKKFLDKGEGKIMPAM